MLQSKIDSLFESRENSFTFVRFVLAILVIVGHSYALGGFGNEPLSIRGLIAGREVAVQAFFAVSGFLIAKSLATDASLWRFVSHRFFRIYPAFLLFLLVVAFALVPWIRSRESFGSYWSSIPLVYLGGNWALQCGEYQVAGVFSGNPGNAAVNGSLWSVRLEAFLYIAAVACAWATRVRPVLVVFGATIALCSFYTFGFAYAGVLAAAILGARMLRLPYGLPSVFIALWLPAILGVCGVGTTVTALLPPGLLVILWPVFDPIFQSSALAFVGGVILWRYRYRFSWTWASAGVAASILCVSLFSRTWVVMMPLALPYLMIVLAYRLPFWRFDRLGDYSYGLYIFSYPIQQFLAHLGVHRSGVLIYTAASIFLSLLAAIFSWHLVEKPCLALGRKLGKAWSAHVDPASRTMSQLA